MGAWDRKEYSISAEEGYTDTSPGIWEYLDLDPAERMEAAPAVAPSRLESMVGNGLQAILGGDWQQLVGLVEETQEGRRVTLVHDDGPDVVPI